MPRSESTEQHRSAAPSHLRVAVLTISDTRTEADDASGALARSLIEDGGHHVCGYEIVRDEPEHVSAQIRQWVSSEDADAVIANGGTGIAPRDQTFETLQGIYDRELQGFGELFRMLSYDEIGAAAMLSRASAGVINGVPVFSLPGSRNAVKLGLLKLILPELGHVVYETRKAGGSDG